MGRSSRTRGTVSPPEQGVRRVWDWDIPIGRFRGDPLRFEVARQLRELELGLTAGAATEPDGSRPNHPNPDRPSAVVIDGLGVPADSREPQVSEEVTAKWTPSEFEGVLDTLYGLQALAREDPSAAEAMLDAHPEFAAVLRQEVSALRAARRAGEGF